MRLEIKIRKKKMHFQERSVNLFVFSYPED